MKCVKLYCDATFTRKHVTKHTSDTEVLITLQSKLSHTMDLVHGHTTQKMRTIEVSFCDSAFSC